MHSVLVYADTLACSITRVEWDVRAHNQCEQLLVNPWVAAFALCSMPACLSTVYVSLACEHEHAYMHAAHQMLVDSSAETQIVIDLLLERNIFYLRQKALKKGSTLNVRASLVEEPLNHSFDSKLS